MKSVWFLQEFEMGKFLRHATLFADQNVETKIK